MRREIEILLIGALALTACSPEYASAKGKNTTDPKDKIIYPTNTLFVPSSTPTLAPTFTPTPTEIPPTFTVTPTETPILPFLYFSETLLKGEKTNDHSKLDAVGCGIAVGGMATRMSPDAYLLTFYDYEASKGKYGPAQIGQGGSGMEEHLGTLRSMGYRPEDISTGISEPSEVIKKIKEFTAKGIPVWINASFYNKTHHSMAVGVDSDGNIIFNDPIYGEGVHIPLKKIGTYDWKVYAILPPEKP